MAVAQKKYQSGPAAPLLNSIDEACRRLGMGRTWLYAQIKAGAIATVTLGRRTLIPESELQRVAASGTPAANDGEAGE